MTDNTASPVLCVTCGGTGKVHEWIDIDDAEFYKATFPCSNCDATRGGGPSAAPARPASPATEPPTAGRVEADDFASDCLRLAALIEEDET